MTLFVIITIIILILVFSDTTPEKPPHTYKAEWGDAGEHLSMFNYGFAVTGSKAITKKVSHTNVALFGPTGSGKSTTVILGSIRSLARAKSSIIINDVSGELWDRTSNYLAKKGYTILRLDFSNSAASESFNPLENCKTISDIQKISQLILRNSLGESKSDPFWEKSAEALISLFARYLVFHATPEYRTLQNVLRLIEKFAVDNSQAVDKLFIKTGDDSLLDAYKATLVLGDKTLQSIIVTARTALNLWSDSEVCKTTSTNSIDFDTLRKKPVALFVSTPLKDIIYFKPLSALFFQSLFNHCLSRIPKKRERSIFFLLDEFAVMRFPSVATTISNIRKYRAGLLICMQDERSLNINYGQEEAHAIKTNCGTLIYLKGQPLHTCLELSKMLGFKTMLDEKGSERKRELMTPDEIRMMEEGLIFINNQPPLKCTMVPYYKNIWMFRLAHARRYPFPQSSSTTPPLFPI